ncbi:DUF1349 domain-containing protein [Kribbella sp. NPDC050124]|uniref:DUF1349 domain-containing protein n=1 Tax=Kribbella sp. NPDC050124 TaxID=3364114 RepID=UPI0037AD83B3
MSRSVQIPGLPAGRWLVEPETWSLDAAAGALTMTAPPGSDLIHEPLHSSRVTDAPAAVFPVTGDFAFSAKVTHIVADGRWSSGALLLWQDEERWAKVCFERNHRGDPSIITVVTNGWSDDGVHWPAPVGSRYLRVMRTGETLVMHDSEDGETWEFVRVFRFSGNSGSLQVGLLVQVPWGEECTARFEEIRLTSTVPSDVRDGT